MRRLPPLPVWTGAAAALLYLSAPAARYNFDGVACAIAVELGDPRHLVHGNHLAYGALGWLFHRGLGAIGLGVPALAALQALSSLLGAAGVAAFTLLLLRLGFSVALAAACSAGLAVSQAYWVWSLEAQVYPLGAALLLWLAAELARPAPSPARAGALHAGAVLGHVGHVMFAPVALARLRGASRRYALVAAAIVLAAYAAAVVFLVRPRDAASLRVWLLGSAALRTDHRFQWEGSVYSAHALAQWLRMSASLLCGRLGPGAAAWLAAAAGAASAWRRRPLAVGMAAGWLLGYACLYLAWQPYTVVYRYSDVPALWLLLACAAESLALASRRAWLAPALAGAAALALGLYNWGAFIRPGADPAANADLQAARWVAESTPPEAWIVVDELDQVYVPYFAHRRPLNIRYAPQADALRARVRQARAAGAPVYAVFERLPAWVADALRPLGAREIAASRSGKLYLID